MRRPDLYYLAVTKFEVAPHSGGGFIFPDLYPDELPEFGPIPWQNGEVAGPKGVGGQYPLSGWDAAPLMDAGYGYRIELTGLVRVRYQFLPLAYSGSDCWDWDWSAICINDGAIRCSLSAEHSPIRLRPRT